MTKCVKIGCPHEEQRVFLKSVGEIKPDKIIMAKHEICDIDQEFQKTFQYQRARDEWLYDLVNDGKLEIDRDSGEYIWQKSGEL